MSSRLKRVKRRKNKSRGRKGENLIKVETPAGSFVGEPRGPDGWLVLHGFEVNPNIPLEQVMQQSGCPVSGESYVKPFEHKYRDLPEHNLLQLREEILSQLTELNGGEEPLLMCSGPLWLELEFLENVLSFELRPPCGCPPSLAVKQGPSDSMAC